VAEAPEEQAVIAGHFGLAAGVKSQERAVPLWALMLATSWLDVVFVPLYLMGVETMEKAPDATGAYGGGIIHANYTHSLLGAAILSVLFGWFFSRWWGERAGIVLGAVSFSHWVLDLIVHRGDLPILIGNVGHLPTFGFGLWRYPAVTAVIELAIVLVGSFLYWRAARDVTADGRLRGRADLSAALVLIFGLAALTADWTGFLAG
jgi:membrane-bound metal-dependent hydrolase YbcI (DUF457 family)